MEEFTEYDNCQLCPRRCGVNRNAGQIGRCGVTSTLKAARAMLHQWEEPPISGTHGSGAVFFSGCPLHCVYCQNADISDGRAGEDITTERLAEIFLELQNRGAHNINLVTPTHYAPTIRAALEAAGRFLPDASPRLEIPIVYNTGGYETAEAIHALDAYVDIYLTDFKYLSPELALKYSKAADYPEVALAALRAMVAQVGEYALQSEPEEPDECAGSDKNLLLRGVVVRQLLLPGCLDDAKNATARIFSEFGNSVCYSLMNQYTPMPGAAVFPELREPVSEDDYSKWIDFALDLGVERSFMQEGGTVAESFIPAFDGSGL